MLTETVGSNFQKNTNEKDGHTSEALRILVKVISSSNNDNESDSLMTEALNFLLLKINRTK